MPKSTPSPMNRTPNATEIRFSEPIASAANPAFKANPAQSVTRIARTNLTERTATSRIRPDQDKRQDGRPDRALLQRRKLLVIERDRSGQAHPHAVLPGRASARSPSAGFRRCARPPGSSASKSSTGRVRTKRRSVAPVGESPVIRRCHETGSLTAVPAPPAPRWLRPRQSRIEPRDRGLIVIRFGTA